jgi:biopolymer transport protein ExbD
MTTTSSARETQVMADINITPFTDVLLVLLIIFMILAALATPPGFQKQLRYPQPKHTNVDIIDGHKPIMVDVTAKDRISIDGTQVSFARLYQMMAATVAFHDHHRYSRHIALYADTNTSYNAIIKILDAARLAGDEDVGFVIQ